MIYISLKSIISRLNVREKRFPPLNSRENILNTLKGIQKVSAVTQGGMGAPHMWRQSLILSTQRKKEAAARAHNEQDTH